MSCKNAAICLKNVSKNYKLFKKPSHRLWQMLPWNKNKKLYKDFYALHGVDLQVNHGEVLGVVGKNGAGKSTLLQIVCGTLQASSGDVHVRGRITALLELGSGFNPEFTGVENIYLAGAIAGLSKEQIQSKMQEIVEFADIGQHLHQPVKTYSSGMLVRLAFSVATAVEPDILVIDEALSVGDGAFAKKSFDKIMSLKKIGCKIHFLSHNTYQVEVFCDKAMWLKDGQIVSFGKPSEIIDAYNRYLDGEKSSGEKDTSASKHLPSYNRVNKVEIFVDGQKQENPKLMSEKSDFCLHVHYKVDLSMPKPTLAIVFTDENMKNISCAISSRDGFELGCDKEGSGKAQICFEKIALLRGRYLLHVLMMCENSIHIYNAVNCATLEVEHEGYQVGVVAMPHKWG